MFHNRYGESLDVLYSNTLFRIDDLKVLQQFLDLCLASGTDIFVRSMYFDWASFVWFDYGSRSAVQAYMNEHWYPVCQRFGRLRGLRDLWVTIQPGTMYKTGHDFGNIDYLFRSLRRITTLRVVLGAMIRIALCIGLDNGVECGDMVGRYGLNQLD